MSCKSALTILLTIVTMKREMAGWLGCTTEFRKWEGITYNAANKKLYTAISAVERGMEDGHSSNDKGTENHIRVGKNSCGCVMEMDVDPVTSRATKARMLTCGIPNTDPSTKSADACVTHHIANPDNVAMIPKYNQLLIGEDTSKHANNLIWVYDLPTGKMTRSTSHPSGAETTSPYWFTVGRWDYMSMVVQHPKSETTPCSAYMRIVYVFFFFKSHVCAVDGR